MIPTKTETKVFFVYSVNQVAGATWPEDFNFVGVWNDEEDAKEHVKTLNKEVREREGLLGDQFYAMLEEPVDEDDEHAIHEDHEPRRKSGLAIGLSNSVMWAITATRTPTPSAALVLCRNA